MRYENKVSRVEIWSIAAFKFLKNSEFVVFVRVFFLNFLKWCTIE